jgi:hypothetical protein
LLRFEYTIAATIAAIPPANIALSNMHEDIFLYRVKLPTRHNEAVMACNGGYTIYIDIDLDENAALKAYEHAIRHIHRGDCDWSGDVQEIEAETHKNT